jgi:hypothetical protein
VLTLLFTITNDREIPKKPNIIVDTFPAIDSAGLYFPTGVDPVRLLRVVSAMLAFGLLPAKDRSFRIQAMTGN